MSIHEGDSLDAFLGRCLKNWVAHFRPPADGRARLLEKAATYKKRREERNNLLSFFSSNIFTTNNPNYNRPFRMMIPATTYILQMGTVGFELN